MNHISKLFQRLFRRTAIKHSMESMDDYLYYSQEKLKNIIRLKKDDDLGILEYLKNVKYAPVQDFTPGLEWFNVTEPLSFKQHLKGKIVILDFFTYCCINCMHIIPDLREIENEFSVEDGLVVVGVHSAKFENEKISSNILAAVQRYNIGHPVVNDADSAMWKNCDVHCWPTLLLLGPSANPIVMFTGEGHKEDLKLCIKNALKYYKGQNMISNHKLPFKSAFHLLPDLKGPLLFPGKITNFFDGGNHEILAVSDTGNNRILIMKDDGVILQQIGGKKSGFKDGNLEESEFNSPQGLVFLNKDVLFVADTENHAIRKVDLKNRKVETVAGTGIQGEDGKGGKLWAQQPISSPWDVCVYTTSDMDLTFHLDGKPPTREVLIIAMAGTHQIWALFLQDTVWWKCKKYPAGTCINIAGSGKEENRNNMYPHAAAFAQPSGVALCPNKKEVYIADSESSSIRRLSLVDGKVTPVVGGDRNPNNLFAFGDKDGALYDAKLQHVLGLAVSADEKYLFVADTYNHKLKVVALEENKVTSLAVPSVDATDGASCRFREPAGLCVSRDNRKVYLADTNNHEIKVLHLDAEKPLVKSATRLILTQSPSVAKPDRSKYQVIARNPIKISAKGGKLALKVSLSLTDGLGWPEGAPQAWAAALPDATWAAVPAGGSDVSGVDAVVSVPAAARRPVDLAFDLVTCADQTCRPRRFLVRVPVEAVEGGDTSVGETVDVVVGADDVRVR